MNPTYLRSAILALTIWPLTAGAICDRLEFAELESLTREQLLAIRCEYHRDMYESPAAVRGGSLRDMQWGAAVANRCAAEQIRMDRILARKYAITGDEAYVVNSITALCPKPGTK